MNLTNNKILNKDISSHLILTKDEERHLLKQAQNGHEESIHVLIMHNLKLVISIRNKLISYASNQNIWSDAITVGVIGLHNAINDYKFIHNTRFATYANWHIKAHMYKLLYEDRLIRVPNSSCLHMNRLKNILADHNLEFTLDSIFSGKCDEIIEASTTCKKSVISFLMTRPNNFAFLDAPLGVGSESHTGYDIVGVDNSDDISSDQKEELIYNIKKMLQILSEKQRFVIVMRFGLHGNMPHTLQEVSDVLNLTRERVRQIQVQALTKLRKSDIINKIKGS